MILFLTARPSPALRCTAIRDRKCSLPTRRVEHLPSKRFLLGSSLTFPDKAGNIRILRFLCLHIPSACVSEMSASESEDGRAHTYWWRCSDFEAGGGRVAERMKATLGDRISSYMSSPRYDHTQEVDGESFPRRSSPLSGKHICPEAKV